MVFRLSTDVNDIIFGATGTLLSHNQLKNTVISRDVRVTNIGIGRLVFKPAFFNAYESGIDVLKKSASIVLAPLPLLVEAIANLFASFAYLLISLGYLGLCGGSEAADNIIISGTFLLSATKCLFAAFMSPILNFIDLLGSGAVTLANGFFRPDHHDESITHERSDYLKEVLANSNLGPTGNRL